jgi:acyl-CoA oxidase
MCDSIDQKKDFSKMDVLHHLLAGFKAHFSEEQVVSVDKCRRACGGAGYNSSSGFTEIANACSPIPTYEGDNIVMLG